MSLAHLFSGTWFQATIESFASQCGWRIAEIDDRKAVLLFNMNSGRKLTLFVVRFETTLEFSVPSTLVTFDREEEIPDFLSTILLKRNCECRYGFWCIENIGSKHHYSCMHNAELSLIDREYFEKVVRALLRECDTFEEILEEMVRQRRG